MCLFRRRPFDPTSRRIFFAGNLCLICGILLTYFLGSFGNRHPDIFLALRFLLMGSAIGLMFWSSYRNGRCASGS